MVEKVIFIADDGTEFEHEDECLEYECFHDIMDAIGNGVKFWDCSEKEITLNDFDGDIKSFLEEIHYARGENVESFFDEVYNHDLEHHLLCYDSFRDEAYDATPDDLLMYDGDYDYWVNVNKRFENDRNILKIFSGK